MNQVNSGTEHLSGAAELSPVSPEQGLAGRGLSAAILEKVFGRPRPDPITRQLEYGHLPIRRNGWTWINGEWMPFDSYSTEIGAAMQVLDKADGLWELNRYPFRDDGADEDAEYVLRYSCSLRFGDKLGSASDCDSAPLAICRAALVAVAHNEPKRDAETTTAG